MPLKDEAKNALIIEKEDLENKGFISVEQALQYQPLITFSNVGFGNNIDLRGQGADANRAVKILLNRVPISLLDTSHGVPPYNNIDINDIESIEVLPGGGAVVYGSGTRGGVVNIVTKAPSKDYGRIVLKAMSAEKKGLQGGSVSVSLGRKISDSLFLRADISGGYTPGARNGESLDKSVKAFSNDNNTNVYGAFQAIYNPSESSKLDINVAYSHLWRSYPRTYYAINNTTTSGRNTTDLGFKSIKDLKKERYLPHADTYKTQTKALQASINYTHKLNSNSVFDVLGFYQFSHLQYIKDSYTSAVMQNNGSDGKAGFQNHAGGLNLKYKLDTDSNTLIIGLDNVLEYSQRRNLTDHIITILGQQPSIIDYTADINNKAFKLSNSLYAYDVLHINDSFDLGLGARVEYSNYWTTNNQSYDQVCSSSNNTAMCDSYPTLDQDDKFKLHKSRLGYAAEIAPNFKYSATGNVYIKGEMGFISPSAYQMINADPTSNANNSRPSTPTRGSGIYANEANSVKPERYFTGELGFKDELLGSFISATLFYTHTMDEIFVNSISHGTAYTYSNLGQTQRAGAEVIAAQSLFDSEWLRLSESIAYIYTNIKETNISNASLKGKAVPYVPSLKATLNIHADVYKGSASVLSVFFNNVYFSSSIDSGGNKMNKNGYVLSDLGISYGYKDMKLSLGVRNLFDSWYATYQVYPNYYPGFGRSYFAEVRYGF